MTRYCPKCAAEVDNRGGYCALGHGLKLNSLDSIDGSIDSLRAEIDQVFEAARLEVEGVIGNQAATAARPEDAATGETSPIEGAPVPPPAPAVITTQATPPVDDIPSEDVYTDRARGVWAALEDEVSIEGDPIESFAPAPRMDWGPERSAIFQRLSFQRGPSSAAV